MKCPKCGFETPAGAKFCRQCGTALTAPVPQGMPKGAETLSEPAAMHLERCPACGAEVSAGRNFCRACGAPLPGGGSSRLGATPTPISVRGGRPSVPLAPAARIRTLAWAVSIAAVVVIGAIAVFSTKLKHRSPVVGTAEQSPRQMGAEGTTQGQLASGQATCVAGTEFPSTQDPTRSMKANSEGLRLLAAGQLGAAKSCFQVAARLDESSVEALNNLGYVCQLLGEFQESETYLLRVVQLAPDRKVAYGNLGYSEAKLGKHLEAVSNFRAYIRLFQDEERGKTALRHAITDTDPRVQSALQEALNVSPTNLPASTPLSPANGATGVSTTPAFSWTAVSGASSYRILVATSPAALPTDPTVATCDCVINDTPTRSSHTSATPLAAGTTYYWEVHARSATQFGNWSTIFTFTTQ